MHVYFIRHGETYLNKRHVHQSPNTPLSELGRSMVSTLAEELRGVNPTLLVSSEYTRALESARIISSRTGLTPVTNGLFYEVVRPSKFYSRSLFTVETFWYALLSIVHRNNPTWRYCDAENATDVSNRARKALAYIESLRGDHESVVIVSHKMFINIMIALMCRDRMLDFRGLLTTFFNIGRMKNAGVRHVEYVGNGSENACNWRVVEELV